MTNRQPYLTEPFAYYVAGMALADWLVGYEPVAIYRRGYFPKKNGETLNQQVWKLCELGSDLDHFGTTPEDFKSQFARDRAVNGACISLGGVVGVQYLGGLPEPCGEFNRGILPADLGYAAKMLRPFVSTDDQATNQALQVWLAVCNLYGESDVNLALGNAANAVLWCGRLTKENGDFSRHFGRLGKYRANRERALIEWPTVRDDYDEVCGEVYDAMEARFVQV